MKYWIILNIKEKALKISESFKDCGGVKEAGFLEIIVD